MDQAQTIDSGAMAAVDGVMGSPAASTPAVQPVTPATAATAIDPGAQAAVDGVMHTDTASQLKLNASTTATANPDQEAQHQQLAKTTGIPLETVKALPDVAKAQAAASTIDAAGISQATPATAKFLSDPNNMAIAKDDIVNLQSVEKSVNPFAGQAVSSYTPSLGEKIHDWLADAFGVTAEGRANAWLRYAAGENGMTPVEARAAFHGMSEFPEQFSGNLINSATFGIVPNPAGEPYGAAGEVGSGLGTLAGFFGGPVKVGEKIIEHASNGLFDHVAGTGLGASIANFTADAAKSAATLATATGLANTGNIINSPDIKTGEEKLAHAGNSGAGMGALFTTVSHIFPEATLLQFMARAVTNNVALDKMDNTSPDDQRSLAEKILAYGTNTLFSIAGTGRSDPGFFQDAAKADLAQKAAQYIQGLNKSSAASALRLRDPDKFNQFVTSAAENGPVQNFYVNPRDLAQAKIDPAEMLTAMPEMVKPFQEATALGTDVKIPVADFATKLAGTEFGQAALDHLKTDPEGMSKVEADHFMQNEGPALQAQINKILTEKQGDDTFKASAQAVHDNVMQQLTAANRFTPDVNKPYASLISNFYAVQAARLGITPEEAFAKYPVDISNGIAPPAEGEMQAKYANALEASQKFISDRAANREANKRMFGTPQTLRGFIRKMGGIKDTGGELTSMDLGSQKKFKGVINNNGLDADHMRELAVEAGFLRDAPAEEQSTSTVNDLYEAISQEARGKDVYSDKDAAKVQALADQNAKDSQVDEDERFVYGIQQHAEYAHGIDLTPEEALTFNSLTHDGVSEEDAVAYIKDVRDGVLGQTNRGSFNPETSTINLLRAADLSTFLHESGHFFLETMNKMALGEDAPPEIKADMQTTLDWLGVKDMTEWNGKTLEEQRNAHEQFARGFEAYLFEGKSPSLEMQGVFQRFRSWLLNVYQSLKNLNVELSPEIRGVFDRMLATTEQIKQAEGARNFEPLFKTPEAAGMTPEEFKAYHDLGVQATQTAIDDLQTRSLGDMQWASNAKAGVIKKLQREAQARRDDMKEHVTKEVMDEPVNKAREFLRKGEIDGKPVEGPHRLDLDATKQKLADKQMYYGVDTPNLDNLESKFGKYGVLGRDGLHPDTVADMFGFSSGDELIKQLIQSENANDKIEGVTDQKMLERYGDLTSPEAIDRAANEAIHNQVRTKFVATEMAALDKAVGNKKILAAAAKQYAENMIARLPVRDATKPGRYLAAEKRAAKDAAAALKAGDLPAAARAKREQLINSYAAKAAYDAQAEVERIQRNAKRYDRASVRERIGTDIALIDRLFERFDLRKNPVEKESGQKINLRAWYDAQRDAGYEPSIDERLMVENDRMHYQDMSMEALRGLNDAARSIEKIAKGRKEIMVDGQKVALDEAVRALEVPMLERGEKFSDNDLINIPRKGVDPVWSRALHAMGSWLRSAGTDLKRIDYKRNMYDLHDVAGAFGKYLIEPIFDRAYWKSDKLRAISDNFERGLKELAPDWQKQLHDLVTNKALADPDVPGFMTVTRADLIGMARHFGNESNFAKLYKGYEWDPQVLWKFVMDNMREDDWKAVQTEWDSFENLWPEIEGMAKRLGLVVPDKIELRPFKTPYGDMKGGYAPIRYDAIRSKLSAKFGNSVPDPERSLESGQNYKATTTFNGSMNNRADGYTDRVSLDYHAMTRSMNETVHDLAYREALINARKITSDPKFRAQFMRTFGREEYAGLTKWLDDIRDMTSADGRMTKFQRAMATSRKNVVATGVAYRATTIVKHGTGVALKSLGYLGGGGEKYLLSRVARMSSGNANADIAEAIQKFPEIRSRMDKMDRDYKVGFSTLYEGEGLAAKMDRFGHAGVSWIDALSAIPTAHAAYDWAVTDGIPKSQGGTGQPMSHADAIRYANKIVREAHGSALEVSQSNFMNDRDTLKQAFSVIFGYANNSYGQVTDQWDKLITPGSKFDNRPVILARAMAATLLPGLFGYWMAHAKNQDESWAGYVGKAVAGTYSEMLPFVREAEEIVMATIEKRAPQGEEVPVVKAMLDTAKAGKDAYDEAHGKQTRLVQDALNALGDTVGLPGAGQLGKTGQYLVDVKRGKEHPASALEAVQGATIGVHKARH